MTSQQLPGSESNPQPFPPDQSGPAIQPAPPNEPAYGAVARWRTTFVASAGWDEEHQPRPVAASVVTAEVRRRRHLAPIALLMAAGLLGAVLVVGLLPSGTSEGLLPPVSSSGGTAQAPVSPPEGSDNGQGGIANPPAPGSVVLAPVSVQPAQSSTSNGILAFAETSSALVSEVVHPVQTAAPSNPPPVSVVAQPTTLPTHQPPPGPAIFPPAPAAMPPFPPMPPFPAMPPFPPMPPFPALSPPAPPPAFPVLAAPVPPPSFPLPRPH